MRDAIGDERLLAFLDSYVRRTIYQDRLYRDVTRGISLSRRLAPLIAALYLKPLDERLVEEAAQRVRLLATVEEHNVLGGLGAAVCEVVCRLRVPRRVLRFGVQDRYDSRAGTQESLLDGHGVAPAALAGRVLAALAE